MYVHMHVHTHTHTHAAWIHAYQFLWVDTMPNTVLSIQNQQFEHVNAAGQYPVKLYMLLMMGWADIQPGSVRYCRPIHMQIQFVVLVGQYPSTFCLFLSHFEMYQDSASCYGPVSIHFNLLFLWVTTHLNSGVEVRYLSNSSCVIMGQYLSSLYLVISEPNTNPNSLFDVVGHQPSRLNLIGSSSI